ncbi:MAG: hypothetical protein O2955_08290 [Planctomycetota bacterium]|nr:hypothetical protein [Planctomycetota bacterium]MDA1212502.1 hypothetical protein [Planctomycetota bacterium]
MLRAKSKWAAALLFWGLAGCQCSMLTRYYADAIDDMTDRDLEMDCFYRPTWDLNRIGKPDWCQSAFNRFWCRCNGCNRNCNTDCVDLSTDDYDEIDVDNGQTEERERLDLPPPTAPVAPPRPPLPQDAGRTPPGEQKKDRSSAHFEIRPSSVVLSICSNPHMKSKGDGAGRSYVLSTRTSFRVPSPNILPVV